MKLLASLPEALMWVDKLELSGEFKKSGTSSHRSRAMNRELPELSMDICCLSASATESGSEPWVTVGHGDLQSGRCAGCGAEENKDKLRSTGHLCVCCFCT